MTKILINNTKIISIFFFVLLTFLFFNINNVKANEVLDFELATSSNMLGFGEEGTYRSVLQQFTLSSTSTPISKMEFDMYRTNTRSGNLNFWLYEGSTTTAMTLIATSSILYNDLPTNFATIEISFDNEYLTATTSGIIWIWQDEASPNANNYTWIRRPVNGPTSYATLAKSNTNAYLNLHVNYDLSIKVYINEPIICGDGNLGSGEQCDDGNTTSGDGCSSSCQLEEEEPEIEDPPIISGDYFRPLPVTANDTFRNIFNTSDPYSTGFQLEFDDPKTFNTLRTQINRSSGNKCDTEMHIYDENFNLLRNVTGVSSSTVQTVEMTGQCMIGFSNYACFPFDEETFVYYYFDDLVIEKREKYYFVFYKENDVACENHQIKGYITTDQNVFSNAMPIQFSVSSSTVTELNQSGMYGYNQLDFELYYGDVSPETNQNDEFFNILFPESSNNLVNIYDVYCQFIDDENNGKFPFVFQYQTYMPNSFYRIYYSTFPSLTATSGQATTTYSQHLFNLDPMSNGFFSLPTLVTPTTTSQKMKFTVYAFKQPNSILEEDYFYTAWEHTFLIQCTTDPLVYGSNMWSNFITRFFDPLLIGQTISDQTLLNLQNPKTYIMAKFNELFLLFKNKAPFAYFYAFWNSLTALDYQTITFTGDNPTTFTLTTGTSTPTSTGISVNYSIDLTTKAKTMIGEDNLLLIRNLIKYLLIGYWIFAMFYLISHEIKPNNSK